MHAADNSLIVDDSRNYKNHSTLGTIPEKKQDLRVKQLLQNNRGKNNASQLTQLNNSTYDSFEHSPMAMQQQ